MYKTFIKKTLCALLILGATMSTFAQGKITGKVIDGETNDVLPFANISVKDASIGSTSDFDGLYEINVEPGTYTIVFSFVGYETKEVSGVEVKSSGDVVDLNVTINATAAALEDVVITTTVRKNTKAAVLTLQKNSVKLLDGLSIESIKTTGASNIASAVKNVPGVSVQGGKFVYVRGLGDRYTKSILNGVDVPGLDPDRNTLQLDIFPTNILENILVVKSATADQPADFTGGVVDIITKDLPSREEYSLSVGASYNSSMHLDDNYLNYQGGDTDFLGFDDGSRDNPLDNTTGTLPLPQVDGNTARENTFLLDRTLAAEREKSFVDYNFGFTAGKQFEVGDNRLGVLASLSYRNETTYYEEYIEGQVFRKNSDPSVLELGVDRSQQGEVGINNVLLSGLAGLSYKTEKSKYKFNILHIQNGESEASLFDQRNLIINSNQIKQDNLIYTQRSITNVLFSGRHSSEDASWLIEWKVSPTLSRVYDKDLRTTNFVVSENDPTVFTISASEGGDPRRIWRDLEEVNAAGKLDLTKKHKLFGRDAKTKFGPAYTYKQRDFSVDQFSTPFAGSFNTQILGGDPNQVLNPDNIFNPNTGQGSFVRRDSNISDTFDSTISIAAGYISEEFKLSDRFNAILGVRFEKFDLLYTGESQSGLQFNEESILDEADFFPSANLIYDLNEDANQKLRASYSRTTARPSFKEASIAEIFDPTSNTFFIGNINVQPTYIDNFDIRYEIYGEGANFFAVSAFYKSFDDPIELSFIREATGQFTPLNLGDATVYGAEIEFRRDLAFAGLEHFNVTTNFSLIESEQKFSDDERDAREDNLRVGEELEDGRTLQGQSPFLLNFGINYNNPDNGWQGGAFYNVQGRTLQIVGNGNIPDVFTLPFHSINLTIGKAFGEKKNSSVSLKFSNLLDDDIESVYESFGSEDRVYSKWSPGQEISLSYTYKF
ncbi:TonB-dependent receptor [Aquimarina sp. AU474]|uniref:TonB-dependent receptor n=1 Tax=Aquimarina sp. AU474 TaxID=2108529 RepID=UPI000D6878C7|nr:TonB-dependent receptor [Aquimarina sp. AU474]